MTIFTLIILIIFVTMLAGQFVMAIERNCPYLSVVFAFEIVAFAYLANVLM